MTWSVFDGTNKDSHEDLFRYCRLKKPNGKAVLAALEWADDSDDYITRALDAGLAVSPGECLQLLDEWDYCNPKRLLGAVEGSFDGEQLLALTDILEWEVMRGVLQEALEEKVPLSNSQLDQIANYVDLWAEDGAEQDDEDYSACDEFANFLGAAQSLAQRYEAETRVGFLEGLLIGAAQRLASRGKGKPAASSEPEFKDFNNAWGSNNDHNWEADGDTRWDDHSGM